MIYKLVDKGAIEKRGAPHSDTEVVLTLTEDGQKNYAIHNEYHHQTNDETIRLLRDMPAEFYTYMVKFLSSFENALDQKLNE